MLVARVLKTRRSGRRIVAISTVIISVRIKYTRDRKNKKKKIITILRKHTHTLFVVISIVVLTTTILIIRIMMNIFAEALNKLC